MNKLKTIVMALLLAGCGDITVADPTTVQAPTDGMQQADASGAAGSAGEAGAGGTGGLSSPGCGGSGSGNTTGTGGANCGGTPPQCVYAGDFVYPTSAADPCVASAAKAWACPADTICCNYGDTGYYCVSR